MLRTKMKEELLNGKLMQVKRFFNNNNDKNTTIGREKKENYV